MSEGRGVPSSCGRSVEVRTALLPFLRPRTIAVVGASSNPDTIAGLLFANLVDSHFDGNLFPVNKHSPTVQGIVAYPDLSSCPVRPDLAVVCVPASAATGVVTEAGDLGVRAVCVISAGFGETGPAGAALETSLVQAAGARGVRIVGPNCTGILGGAPDDRFNATFSRCVPRPGRTCVVSQSGAIGLALLEGAEARRLGIGGFVSVGNCADVDSNDLLRYWGEDAGTEMILLYLESIQDPQQFLQIALEVGRRVPIVVVKAGRTSAGRRAAASHTAALSAGDRAVDALLQQAGVIRAGSIEEMLDVASVLASQRQFGGRRVAVVTNGGGPGILAADACEANGLVVPEVSESTSASLRSFLPAEASVSNPIDMIASATAENYGRAVRILGVAPEVDAVIVMFNTPLLTRADEVAAELIAARSELGSDLPLIGVFMNREGPPPMLAEAGIPSFTFPENAALALARSFEWAERRGRGRGSPTRSEGDAGRARRLVAGARQRADGGWLAAADAEALLNTYGVACARSRLVRSPDEASAAQAELGCTVVVKVAAAIHKSDVGGVRLGVNTPEEAAYAVSSIRADLESARVERAGDELLVQELIDSGQEMIVGVNREPLLGPVVMVGLGGKLVELLGDVALRIAPLRDGDIEDMLHSLRSYPLLTGYRGSPALDVEALRQVLHRVSTLADDLPEIAEIDLNPVFILEKGALVADARVRVADDGV